MARHDHSSNALRIFAHTPKGGETMIHREDFGAQFDVFDFGSVRVLAIEDVDGATFDGARSIAHTDRDDKIRLSEPAQDLVEAFKAAGTCEPRVFQTGTRRMLRAVLQRIRPQIA